MAATGKAKHVKICFDDDKAVPVETTKLLIDTMETEDEFAPASARRKPPTQTARAVTTTSQARDTRTGGRQLQSNVPPTKRYPTSILKQTSIDVPSQKPDVDFRRPQSVDFQGNKPVEFRRQQSVDIRRQKSVELSPPDFETLFDNPTGRFKCIYKIEDVDDIVYTVDDVDEIEVIAEDIDDGIVNEDDKVDAQDEEEEDDEEAIDTLPYVGRRGRLVRMDSVMKQTFTQMIVKNWENSTGFSGFKRRMAKEINHKYCSCCRCDDMILVFLYVVLGMAYLSAGVLGLTQCTVENHVNYFLIADGTLSVFIFPITVMEWTKRIGGCIDEHEKLNLGVFYMLVIVLRLAAAVLGTIFLKERMHLFGSDNIYCLSIVWCLNVGVVLEWTFLLCAVFLPVCVYIVIYCVASRL